MKNSKKLEKYHLKTSNNSLNADNLVNNKETHPPLGHKGDEFRCIVY